MTNVNSDAVIIADVTVREYGQNIPASYLYIFTPEIRVEIALRLIDAGFTNIEILSCVHPTQRLRVLLFSHQFRSPLSHNIHCIYPVLLF